MSKKETTFLIRTWNWLRSQGYTISDADKAMNLTVEEYDALIDRGAA
jgi:hypothetical protein